MAEQIAQRDRESHLSLQQHQAIYEEETTRLRAKYEAKMRLKHECQKWEGPPEAISKP
jgi:hypothetical protein